MKRRLVSGAVVVLVCGILGWAADGLAQTRLVVKSARAGTSYYALAIGTSKALMTVPGVEVSVEESLGSVANVKEARTRPTTCLPRPGPHRTGDEEDQTIRRDGYERIRALWVFPVS
jgi:hypothetical protein